MLNQTSRRLHHTCKFCQITCTQSKLWRPEIFQQFYFFLVLQSVRMLLMIAESIKTIILAIFGKMM